MKLLPNNCGVKGEFLGDTTNNNGSPIELYGHFQYEDLAVGIRAFKDIWAQPTSRTEPDCCTLSGFPTVLSSTTY